MRKPRPLMLLLIVLLLGSVALLLRPISEPVTRVAVWNLLDQPADGDRCPAPRAGASRWDVQISGDFPWLGKALRRALGETCRSDCVAQIVARVDPTWVDEPHFFSGFGRIDVPVSLQRTVGGCQDAFRLVLDVTIDEGTRGSAKLAQLHSGQLIGGFLRNLHDASRPWPRRR